MAECWFCGEAEDVCCNERNEMDEKDRCWLRAVSALVEVRGNPGEVGEVGD